MLPPPHLDIQQPSPWCPAADLIPPNHIHKGTRANTLTPSHPLSHLKHTTGSLIRICTHPLGAQAWWLNQVRFIHLAHEPSWRRGDRGSPVPSGRSSWATLPTRASRRSCPSSRRRRGVKQRHRRELGSVGRNWATRPSQSKRGQQVEIFTCQSL